MKKFVPSIKVTFCISANDFDLAEVTKRIGIIPTNTRTRDSFRASDFACTMWTITIKEEYCKAVSTILYQVINVLQGKEKIIQDLCREFDLETSFMVVIHMKDGDSPEVVLPKDAINYASSLNAEISFELYCYE